MEPFSPHALAEWLFYNLNLLQGRYHVGTVSIQMTLQTKANPICLKNISSWQDERGKYKGYTKQNIKITVPSIPLHTSDSEA